MVRMMPTAPMAMQITPTTLMSMPLTSASTAKVRIAPRAIRNSPAPIPISASFWSVGCAAGDSGEPGGDMRSLTPTSADRAGPWTGEGRQERMGMPQETIALLGTGIMGSAMGRRLLGAGFTVRAWNRTQDRAGPLGEAGAAVAATPAEAAEGATGLLTMLSDGDAGEAAASPALPALAPDAVWLQMSTIAIDDTERLARLAAAAGVAFADAPVLGPRQPAEEGKLTVFASGPEELAGRCAPVFGAVAAGAPGARPAGGGAPGP